MLGNLLKQLFRRGAPPSPSAPAPSEDDLSWRAEALQLQRLRRHREVAEIARSVLAAEPDNVDALQVLASTLLAQGNTGEGLACLRRSAELAPESAETQALLAGVLASAGDFSGAIDGYRHATRLRPDFVEAWASLGLLLKVLARYDEAEESCRSGLRVDARHAALRHTLSGALFEQGRVDEAVMEIRASLAIDPGAASARSDLLRMLNYAEDQNPVAVYQEHRAWGERHARPLEDGAPPHRNDPDARRRLRVGFVSPYFRKHAMTFFFESFVEHHDRERLEVVLYADVDQPDAYSARLQGYGASWRTTVGLDDEGLARLVRRDAVDILVDLSGHTPRNRLLAFARRPAPVQVTWNGYPNTTGMSAMNYRITDAFCDPPGATEQLHTETLVRLPEIYMTWRPPQDAPDVGPLPALDSGCVTFGSFNSCFKITPSLVALWARILAAVPGSRLLLLTIGRGAAERRVRELFAAQGVAPDRIEILPRLSHEDFLAAHRRADIALDAFPYHGTTTSCFSLWMGLPVVALAGATHASRVGVTLLSNIGLPQLVAQSGDEYVGIAARLASDLPGLAKLRSGLRDLMLRSPLTDGAGGARALENAFREMWSAWCRSEAAPPPGGRPVSDSRNVVVKSEYGLLLVNRYDSMIGRCVIEDGAWEKDEIELLRWMLTAVYGAEREIEILDVGAYNGVYAIALARFPFPKVTVHAFEAQREIFNLLTATVALNGLDNVRCHHRAVCSESGQPLRFQAIDYDEPGNFGSLEIERVPGPDFDGRRLEGSIETVETIRIDDLGLNSARLLKIDAEGMEHKVLAGASATVKRCRPLIFLEYEKTDFDAVKAWLRAAEYRAYYAQRPNILCIPGEFDRISVKGAARVRY
ncbi:MAG TPA: FkbM family methyltransferase [Burkholderiales bacterium]|nr:FkbM family methyltransferase [Burkholderiales bacterium]